MNRILVLLVDLAEMVYNFGWRKALAICVFVSLVILIFLAFSGCASFRAKEIEIVPKQEVIMEPIEPELEVRYAH